jgi:hypothetical protein
MRYLWKCGEKNGTFVILIEAKYSGTHQCYFVFANVSEEITC